MSVKAQLISLFLSITNSVSVFEANPSKAELQSYIIVISKPSKFIIYMSNGGGGEERDRDHTGQLLAQMLPFV